MTCNYLLYIYIYIYTYIDACIHYACMHACLCIYVNIYIKNKTFISKRVIFWFFPKPRL